MDLEILRCMSVELCLLAYHLQGLSITPIIDKDPEFFRVILCNYEGIFFGDGDSAFIEAGKGTVLCADCPTVFVYFDLG